MYEICLCEIGTQERKHGGNCEWKGNAKITHTPAPDGIAAENKIERNVPDGGWGWVVVIATLTFNTIFCGCSFSFGVLYTDLLDYFGDTKSNTAWIGSLFFSLPSLFAPVAAKITKRLGSRKATMLGGLVASVGFAVGSFSNSVWMLIIFYGLVGGIGMSLPYFNSFKTVTDYFDKRLALASGIAESGVGLGTVIFAPFTEFLVSCFGWRGTLLIQSGLVANIIVCGALYRPLKHNSKSDNVPKRRSLEDRVCMKIIEIKNETNSTPSTNVTATVDVDKVLNRNIGTETTWHEYHSRMFSVAFIIFVVSNFTMYFWYDVPYVFTVDRSVSFGMSARKASYLLSAIGLVHLFSIIGYGILGNRKFVNRAALYGLSTALCGVSVLIVPFFQQFSVLAILSGCFGIFSAPTEALLSCILIEIVGKEAFDNFFCGFVLFMEGIANLIGPPFAGFLFDCTGSYNATFFVAGACIITAGVLYTTLAKVKKQQ